MKTVLVVVLVFGLAAGFGCQKTARAETVRSPEAVAEDRAPAAPVTEPNVEEDPVADSPTSAGSASSRAGVLNADANDKGPTVLLSYGPGKSETNSIQSFMYFVPLISPVPVDRAASAGNDQEVSVVSYERKITSRSFAVECEFEMIGQGSIRYTFDPAKTIARKIEELKKSKGEPLANVLDYINFEGAGFGRIQVKGTVDHGTPTVTEVNVEFDARGHKSPVTIGLYDVKAKSGQYGYENRSNQVIARVNALTFKKSKDPRMDISLASIARKAGGGGFFGHLKAAFANLFIKPVRVNPRGNEALLRFGHALFEQQTAFTFPKADNLKEVAVFAVEAKER